MCLQDWRLGTQIRSVLTAISVTSATTQTFPANPQRVGIMIASRESSTGTRLLVSVGGVDGFSVGGTAGVPFIATLETHGDLPTRQFVVTGVAVGANLGLAVEWFLPQEVTTAALEEFKRQYPTMFRG